MSNIIQHEQLPAHIRQALATNIPSGFDTIRQPSVPAIKVSALGIKIVDGQQVLAEAPAGAAMNIVVLDSSPVGRVFYRPERQYQSGSTDAPDCSSFDGITPDAGRDNIQSSACASCPQNVIGSDPKNIKGRACRYRRTVAAVSVAQPDKLLRLSLGPTSMFSAPDVNDYSTLEPYIGKVRELGLKPHFLVTQIIQSPESVQTRVLFKRVDYLNAELLEQMTAHLLDPVKIQMALGNPTYFTPTSSEEVHDPRDDSQNEVATSVAPPSNPRVATPAPPVQAFEQPTTHQPVASAREDVLNYIPYQPIEVADEATYWCSVGHKQTIGVQEVPVILEILAGQPLPDNQWDELSPTEYRQLLEQQQALQEALKQQTVEVTPPRRTRRTQSTVSTGQEVQGETVAASTDLPTAVAPPKTRRSTTKVAESTGAEAGVATTTQAQALNTAMSELFGEDD